MISDPIALYAYLTMARVQIFNRIQSLDPDAWTREFPIGPGTLAKTLTHTLVAEWYYVQRILENALPPYEQWPLRDETELTLDELRMEWIGQASETQGALANVGDWEAPIEYEVTLDDGRRQHVTASAEGLAAQLVMHEVHHRAQVLNMLRQLDAPIEEDLDYNAMTFVRRDLD